MKLTVGTRVLVGPKPTSFNSDFVVHEAANKEGVIRSISGKNYTVTMDDTKDYWYFSEEHVTEIKPEPEVEPTLKETLEGLLAKAEEARTAADAEANDAKDKLAAAEARVDELKDALKKLYPTARQWASIFDIPKSTLVVASNDTTMDLYINADGKGWWVDKGRKTRPTYAPGWDLKQTHNSAGPFIEVVE